MAEKPSVPPPPDSAGDVRGQLVKRLAVAGVLVAILLGMLAFFDYLAKVPEDDGGDGQVFTRPVPVAPKKEVSQPVTPATDLPPPPSAEPPPVAPTSEVPPVPAPAAAPVPPVAPSVDGSKPESKPESKPTPRVENRPTGRSTAAVPRPAPPAEPIAEETAPPAMAPPKEAAPVAAARPTARVVEAPTAPLPPPGVNRLLSGFLLQAGVFSSAKSAEELHARLTLSGVPSTLETRVQVGPFRTRQEAEAAQQKLKALGVETILVPPAGAKR